MPRLLTEFALKTLDWIAARTGAEEDVPESHRTGHRGEEAAYFYLRRLGYTMVARNFRSPRRRGEIDLIGWEGEMLCFIEVKSRTSRDVKPAEAAVDREKQKDLASVAREYLNRLPGDPAWRFDVISVYFDNPSGNPQMVLFRNAFGVA